LYSGAGNRKTIWRMRIACWIPKATNTHNQVAFLAFLLQQYLQEGASLLRYAYIAVFYVIQVD
jgi:hypothetical protein